MQDSAQAQETNVKPATVQEGEAESPVAVIIVNFNAGDALCRCVESVLSQEIAVRVTVVDNASSDDSHVRMENHFRDGEVSLIRNDTNLGFAPAVNQAAADPGRAGGARYLLVLNPDCEMQPASLRELKKALDEDPEAGLAGPTVVDREGQVMRGTLRRFPGPWKSLMTFSGLWRLERWNPGFKGVEMSHELPADTAAAEAVSGACMLLRWSVFEDIGYLDSSYGLHCEDLDLMYRLRLRGLRCLIVPSARVYHRQGLSSRSRPLWVHWQKHLGMQRFFLKFQAEDLVFPLRWLVLGGIWLRFGLTLPLALLRN